MRAVLVACMAALLLVGASRPAAATVRDYDAENPEWNGTSELARLAGDLGAPLTMTDHLDWNELDPERDILFVLYPRDLIDGNGLLAWIEEGGRALLADDFGRCDQALAALGIERVPARGVRAARFHEDNVSLPVATPWQASHPLARGVQELVTNHPAILRGEGGVLGFGDGQALVIAGERGGGRFVALGDPSVLINGMLAFGGNVSFAANVVRWLTPPAGARRVVLLTQTFLVTGTPPAPARSELGLPKAARALGELGHELRDVASWTPELPALRALGVAAAALIVLLVMWRLALLRRPSSGGVGWLRALAEPAPTDATSLALAHDDPRGDPDLGEPALLLRDHLEARLAAATGLADPLGLPAGELARALETRRGPAAARALAELEAAGLRQLPTHRPARSPTRREWERVYDAARRLDAALSEDPS